MIASGILLFVLSCGGDGAGAPPGGGTSASFARVQEAHEGFVAASAGLAEAEARSASEDPEVLRAARAGFDAAYRREQKVLALFLTFALNERPHSRETLEALALYAKSATANAGLLLRRGGDPARAVECLEGAERAFRALGLPPPPEVVRGLAEARQRVAGGGSAAPDAARPGAD